MQCRSTASSDPTFPLFNCTFLRWTAHVPSWVRYDSTGTKKTLQTAGDEEERAIRINPSLVSLFKMLAYMTYIAHILGCMWHWLVTFEGQGISWASKFGVEEVIALACVRFLVASASDQ